MIEHALNKALDSFSRLFSEFLSDPGLLEACLVYEIREKLNPPGTAESYDEPEAVRHIAAAFPLGVDLDNDL
ncbi:MAG: hypothetical protein ACP5R5_10670 [Armatimonadota bacterium]